MRRLLRLGIEANTLALGFWEQSADATHDVRAGLPMLQRNASLLSRLIDDLLDGQSIINGKQSVDRRPLDFHTVVAGGGDADKSCDRGFAAGILLL